MDPITIGAIGSGIGGLINYFGQQETNSKNIAFGRETNAMNMEEAQRNRDFQFAQTAQQMAFQERMANTAVQRQVEDMRKAGINPLMAATGGASSPTGAAASGSQGSAQAVKVDNPYTGLSSMVSSALDVAKTLGDLDIQTANKKLIAAQTAKIGVDTETAKKDLPRAEMINEGYKWLKQKWNQWITNGQSAKQLKAGEERSKKNMMRMIHP